jgi:vanillate O-demethylase monooxygenase subunit
MPGTAARYHGEAPQEPPVHARFTCQAVTPLTETETCYFFGFGPCREHAEHEPIFYEMGLKAFNEDRVMIEAQQRVIDRDPSRRMAPIAIDTATTRFRGIMRRLMREEQETTMPIAVPAE